MTFFVSSIFLTLSIYLSVTLVSFEHNLANGNA